MPHTDTNISRDALRSYGMQPARREEGRRQEERAGYGRDLSIRSDGEDVNPAKVYVDVLAEFTRRVSETVPDHVGGRPQVYDRPRQEMRAAGQPQGRRNGAHVHMPCGRAGSESVL